jgi:hypothetical protein
MQKRSSQLPKHGAGYGRRPWAPPRCIALKAGSAEGGGAAAPEAGDGFS